FHVADAGHVFLVRKAAFLPLAPPGMTTPVRIVAKLLADLWRGVGETAADHNLRRLVGDVIGQPLVLSGAGDVVADYRTIGVIRQRVEDSAHRNAGHRVRSGTATTTVAVSRDVRIAGQRAGLALDVAESVVMIVQVAGVGAVDPRFRQLQAVQRVCRSPSTNSSLDSNYGCVQAENRPATYKLAKMLASSLRVDRCPRSLPTSSTREIHCTILPNKQ